MRKEVTDGDDDDTGFLSRRNRLAVIDDSTVAARISEQQAEGLVIKAHLERVADHTVDLDRQRPRLHASDGLRLAIGVDEKASAGALFGASERQAHSLGCRRTLIEQRGVCDRKTGELGDHSLKVQQRLKTPLADLGLIGRVLRIPPWVFKDVSLDDGRRVRAVIAHADKGFEHLILADHRTETSERLGLGERLTAGCVKCTSVTDPFRHRMVAKILEARAADGFEHLLNLVSARTDVAGPEGVDGLE